MKLTVEQVNAYNDYVNNIKTTVDITLEIFKNAPRNTLKEVIISNGTLWKNIQTDLDKSDFPRAKKIELIGICIKGYNEYCAKMKIFIEHKI